MNDYELAKWLAQEAGQLLMEVRGDIAELAEGQEPDYDIEQLGKVGDRTANDFLIRQLKTYRPGDFVLSEESRDPRERLGAERLWIIDPLDGTSSFSRGYPGFAVQVALWEATATTPGKITAAAVCVPMIGVTLTTGDLQDSIDLDQIEAEVIRFVSSPTSPPEKLDQVAQKLTESFAKPVSHERRGSVGAKVIHIISGHADIYLNTRGFNEWDIAAPVAVAHHYGLASALPDGSAFEFNQPDVTVAGAVISRPKYLPEILKAIAE